jgi:hypothetical protein
MQLSKTRYFKLMDEPLVCVIVSGFNFASGISLCLKEAGTRDCNVFVWCYWHVPDIAKTAALFKQQAYKEFPNLKLTYLCQTDADMKLLRKMGVDALHVCHNALLDEKLMNINFVAEKKYPAVHIASVETFKRHYLAWGLRNIAVVTYDPFSRNDKNVLAGYKELGFVNFSAEKGILPIARNEVQKIISQSHCGLILSAKEGGNYASTEYLLCGIPVVSTPSKGGRDEFFNTRHVKIVEPKAEAIELAVAEWNQHAPDPNDIRETVLIKIKEHRKRFIEKLNNISGRDYFAMADENYWLPFFVDKLVKGVVVDPEDTIKIFVPFSLRKKFTKFVRLFWKKRTIDV